MYLNTLNSNILTDTVLPFRTFTISNHKNQTKKSFKSGLFQTKFLPKNWLFLIFLNQCFHSGQNFWLRPEILAFFQKARNRPEKARKGQNLYNLPQKKPETGQNFAKRAEIYTISQIPIAVRDGTSRKFDFVWKKLVNFQKNDLKCNKNANFAVWGSKFNNRFSALLFWNVRLEKGQIFSILGRKVPEFFDFRPELWKKGGQNF